MGKKWNSLQEQKLISEQYERLLQDCEDFESKSEQEKEEFLRSLDEDEQYDVNSRDSFNLPLRQERVSQQRNVWWRCWQFLCCER